MEPTSYSQVSLLVTSKPAVMILTSPRQFEDMSAQQVCCGAERSCGQLGGDQGPLAPLLRLYQARDAGPGYRLGPTSGTAASVAIGPNRWPPTTSGHVVGGRSALYLRLPARKDSGLIALSVVVVDQLAGRRHRDCLIPVRCPWNEPVVAHSTGQIVPSHHNAVRRGTGASVPRGNLDQAGCNRARCRKRPCPALPARS